MEYVFERRSSQCKNTRRRRSSSHRCDDDNERQYNSCRRTQRSFREESPERRSASRCRRARAPSVSPERVRQERARYLASTYRQRSPQRRTQTINGYIYNADGVCVGRQSDQSHTSSGYGYSGHQQRRSSCTRRSASPRRSRSPERHCSRRDNRNARELAERMSGFSFHEPRTYYSHIDRIYEIDSD